MKTYGLAILAAVAAAPVMAQETREMDSHVHGVSTMTLVVEGDRLEIELTSPGVNIVGFEYAASSDADKDAIAQALRAMLVTENIVSLPDAAQCRLTDVAVNLNADDDEHHDDHGDDAHNHDDDHDNADAENADSAEHTEFHATYGFDCGDPAALTRIGLPFFDQFPNAQEIEAQFVTDAGASAAEIDRDTAELVLNDA
ncbi:DUF2796 domain-containing protein [Loktanella sp. SALINAS62]|uniref:DUF2796 domain-containing protein n=1 Tax=Loktanella sp. SALINAS62 TaxID=2706124 RepID=UPI001B8D512F|nr:DUF2796 domain-containing protein [Loktanella sp. SALINAS62]MBS1302900.1 DUF2796 domain-containing protein [Loktanella sp. SALINAS62]